MPAPRPRVTSWLPMLLVGAAAEDHADEHQQRRQRGGRRAMQPRSTACARAGSSGRPAGT